MTNACRPRCTSLARPWRAAIVDRTQETYAPRSPGGTAVRGPRSAAAARRKLRRAPISADTRPSAPASIPSTAAPGVRKRGCGSITERTFGAPCWRTSILKTLLFAPAGFAQVAGLRRLISKAFRISTSGHTRGRAARRRPRATGPHTAHSSPTQPGRQRPHSCLSTKLSVCLTVGTVLPPWPCGGAEPATASVGRSKAHAEWSGAMSHGCGKVSDTRGLHKDPALAS